MYKINKPLIRVLLVTPEGSLYKSINLLISELEENRCEIEWTKSYQKALEAMSRGDYDICLLDHSIKNQNGLMLLQKAAAGGFRSPYYVVDRRIRPADLSGSVAIGRGILLREKRNQRAFLEQALDYSLGQTKKYAGFK
jgi:CheY-like chemotaxis protein